MEQTDPGKCHGDTVLVAGLDDLAVADGTARLCDILHAALSGALNVVSEGEEGVTSQGNALHAVQPGAFFLSGENIRLLCKEMLPVAVGKKIHVLRSDVNVDGVVPFRAAHILLEGKVEDLGSLAQIPVVRFAAGKSRAVHAGLLSCPDADGLSVRDVAYGIGLGVLQGDEGDQQILLCVLGDILVLHDTGAHGHSMGYNYNGRLRSAELLLHEDGTVDLIRRAETPQDYFATIEGF